jgi:tripartite-type tricarboxylate transporter receptor subunit TctC
MEKFLPDGINVIVTNKPGAGGKVAAGMLYEAEPDGYTEYYRCQDYMRPRCVKIRKMTLKN